MTTVEYTNKKRGTRLYFTLGASLTIVLIVSMFLFPGPWGAFIYVMVSGLAGGILLSLTMGAINVHHNWAMKKIIRENARLNSFSHTQNVFRGDTLIQQAHDIKQPQLPAVIEGAIVEQPATMPRLLDVLQSDKTPIIFFGPQQSGKTNSAIFCAESLKLPTLFIALKNETKYHYSGMDVYSEEKQPGHAALGIDKAMQALNNYDPMIIFIDDLINVGLLAEIEPLIVSLATQAQSHNKRVFLTVQATDKASMGLGKYGAQLKNNFALVDVPKPVKDNNLIVIEHSNIATLFEPGDWKNGELVRLPGPVYFPPKSDTEQFVKDYFTLSQNENIKKHVGAKNAKTTAEYLARVQSIGLPPKPA